MSDYGINLRDCDDVVVAGNTVSSITDWALAGVRLEGPPTPRVSGQDGGTGPGWACTDKAG